MFLAKENWNHLLVMLWQGNIAYSRVLLPEYGGLYGIVHNMHTHISIVKENVEM